MGNCLKTSMPYKNLMTLIISDKNKHYFLVPNMVLSYMGDVTNPYGKYINKYSKNGNQISSINKSNSTFGIFCYETLDIQPNKYLGHVIFKFKYSSINTDLLTSNVILSSKNIYKSDGDIQILEVVQNKLKANDHMLFNYLLQYNILSKIITKWHINLINLYKELNQIK